MKERLGRALASAVPSEHLRMKLIHHGYISLTSLERNALPTRHELKTAVMTNGGTANDFDKLITFGIYK